MATEPHGVILRVRVYTGALDDIGGKGHTTKVVLNLLEDFLDSGHSIYMDNFYNSLELANKLTARGTYCTGTLSSKRRYNPNDVITKKLKKGETIAKYSDCIMIGKWKNKRDVLYISNEYSNEMVDYLDKRNRNGQKPKAILHYNMHMRGVDRQDQMNSYYPCDRKTLRWYKKIGIHFMQLMLLNSYFLYNKYSGSRITLYEFRLSVLSDLLQIKDTRMPLLNKNLLTKHVLTKIVSKAKDGRVNRKRCKACSTKKLRKQTTYHCENCPGQPGFFVGECFDSAHP